MCDVSARYALSGSRSRENFWRDASSARRRRNHLPSGAFSLARCEQAAACLAYGCPILNTRGGGGELRTLEPCHRSRPGTAPSHRRRSPSPRAAVGGRPGAALHDYELVAWEPVQRPGYRVRGRGRFVGRPGEHLRRSASVFMRSDVFAQAKTIIAPTPRVGA